MPMLKRGAVLVRMLDPSDADNVAKLAGEHRWL